MKEKLQGLARGASLPHHLPHQLVLPRFGDAHLGEVADAEVVAFGGDQHFVVHFGWVVLRAGDGLAGLGLSIGIHPSPHQWAHGFVLLIMN